MDQKLILQKFEGIEKTQGRILFYVRVIAEQNYTGEVKLPEVCLNDQEVMFKLSWSKSTLKRRRADGRLPYKRIGNKYYYREADVFNLLFPED